MSVLQKTKQHITFRCDKCNKNIQRPIHEALVCPFCKTEEPHPSTHEIVVDAKQLKTGRKESKTCTGLSIEKTRRWIKAVKKWKDAGYPNRTDEEVDRLYVLCEQCEFFSEHGSCKLCGCNLSKSKFAFLNKIRMATEDCPKDSWVGEEIDG